MDKGKYYDGRPITVITINTPGTEGLKVLYTGPLVLKENSSKTRKPKKSK
jgi:hypothetical protein